MEDHKIRYGDYLKEVGFHRQELSYNDLNRYYSLKKAGRRWLANPMSKEWLMAFFRLFVPYLKNKTLEQIRCVMPLVLALFGFQLLILRIPPEQSLGLAGGVFLVIFGLTLFLDGLRHGLMPLGEQIGNLLPTKATLFMVLGVAMILGLVVTFAEPSIGAMQSVGASGGGGASDFALRLLLDYPGWLTLAVALGVGLAASLGVIKSVYSIKLKLIVPLLTMPLLLLSTRLNEDGEFAKVIGLAFDCGAATTGPVTVPILLSLGVGMSAAVGRQTSAFSGFGLVTLAALMPVITVLLAALFVYHQIPASDQTLEAVAEVSGSALLSGIVGALRAILPLILLLLILLRWLTGKNLPKQGFYRYGFVLSLIGLAFLNLGLSYGLIPLGAEVGQKISATFTRIDSIIHSPIYSSTVGIFMTLAFAFLLGFGSAMAEPALNTLGRTVEDLSTGAIASKTLVYAVAVGVGTGFVIGMSQILWQRVFFHDFAIIYCLAILLTVVSREEFVQVAWDSGVVTTGPVTVPLILALGLGFSQSLGSSSAFGMVALTSLCPVISVLATGLYSSRVRVQSDGGK
ncbi:MAG: DUF1538 domain-containing protein [Candidatus Cloacimonetes bacterium]|nr:DUF1538 domain-containing protein [Candidatus Cloacimonadota bacterium]